MPSPKKLEGKHGTKADKNELTKEKGKMKTVSDLISKDQNDGNVGWETK